MKECLQCKNNFKASSTKMKFCSGGCRLKFHRGKVKAIDSEPAIYVQTQVLYNAMLDMMTKLVKSTDFVYPPKDIPKIESETSPFFTRFKIVRSFDNYQQLKLDCESSESWNELKNEILESNLSSKQKAFLIN